MATKRKYKSDAFEAIHSSATALHKVGAIGKRKMRDFDEAAFRAPDPLEPGEIKSIRERARVSRAVLARHLNTSESTVEKWETGAQRPNRLALKMLHAVKQYGLAALD